MAAKLRDEAGDLVWLRGRAVDANKRETKIGHDPRVVGTETDVAPSRFVRSESRKRDNNSAAFMPVSVLSTKVTRNRPTWVRKYT